MKRLLKGKISKSSLLNFVAAIFFAFRQSTKVFFAKGNAVMAANIDPFYIPGVVYAINFKRMPKYAKRFVVYSVALLIYAFLQIIILKDLDILKLFVNYIKIVICIFTMLYVKDNYNKYSIFKIAKIGTILITLTTLCALLLQNSEVLWRFRDGINKYDLTRLHGLFLEPSELGFHAMILLIILFAYILTKKMSKKDMLVVIGLILCNGITIYLAKPFGAIVVGVIAITSMLIYNLIKKFTYKKLMIFLGLLVAGIILIIILYNQKNAIIYRAIDTINGKDLSNNYRVSTSLDVLQQSFVDYKGLGLGFGNMHTESFSEQYASLGVASVVANSFQYFIIEGGLFAIVSLILLWIEIIHKSRKNFTHLKVGILVFLFAYQIFGGHFTSGLTWALYGLCMSEFREENEI